MISAQGRIAVNLLSAIGLFVIIVLVFIIPRYLLILRESQNLKKAEEWLDEAEDALKD